MKIRSLALGVLFFLATAALAELSAVETEAVKATEIWLALVDAGQYADSWETAAPFLKNGVPEGEWVRKIQAVREPMGALVSRKLKSAKFLTSLPGAPDGEYVVIQYETSFDRKKTAVETVTPMKTEDGSWKVSGYYIK